MKETQANKPRKPIYLLALTLVLLGAFIKVMHYPFGIPILLLGFTIGAVCSIYDIGQLRKKIKLLEKEIEQNR
jgi:NhaP-type Na+/H+ and K+/H+ antiporter